jgi:hypothetical protein
MNGVISDHSTYIAPSYPSVTTSLGAFCGDYTTYSTSVLSKKDPEEVVTDGYEGAIYVHCGQR